jgi:paired amphipathic helix protein Sin3a
MKKPKHAVGQDLTPSSYNTKHNPIPSPPRRTTQLPPVPRGPAVSDDIQFFDRVKRMLDNRETYNEFLKVINLFTQDYIDSARLIKESRNFLGDSELMKQFKDILGWNERKEREQFIAEHQTPHGWTRPVIAGVQNRPSRAELNVKYGSYRKLPESVRFFVACQD